MEIYDLHAEEIDSSWRFEDIIARLDAIFLQDWRNFKREIAALLRALDDNGVLLYHFISKAVTAQEWPRLVSSQSFLIHSTEKYYMRLNLWFERDYALHRETEFAQYLSIDQPHNHNFCFFTTNLIGPGYTTTFFNVPEATATPDAKLKKGQAITIENVIETALNGSRVIYVEKDSDFHSQHWPTQKTLTVNIVPLDPSAMSNRQYIIDIHKKTVQNVIKSS